MLPYGIFCTILLSHNDMPEGGVYREDGGGCLAPSRLGPAAVGAASDGVTHSPMRHKAAGGIPSPLGDIFRADDDSATGTASCGGESLGTGGDGTKCRRDMQVSCKSAREEVEKRVGKGVMGDMSVRPSCRVRCLGRIARDGRQGGY